MIRHRIAGPVSAMLVAASLGAPCLASVARDEVRIEPVRFATGATSTVVRGEIRGWQMVDYQLRAGAGQTMRVAIRSDNASNYFNVSAPGADEALFIGAMSGEAFSGVLPIDGDYTVRVYLMRNEARRGTLARYEISFSITSS